MEAINQIEEKIREGMKHSCNDSFLFVEDESMEIASEYLLTVNVAKRLASLNQYIGHPYKIYLERKTRLIASDCVPLVGRAVANNFLGYVRIIRDRLNTSRNGRADITLYGDTGGLDPRPICVIELKGFNPSNTNIAKDLTRNSEYFQLASRTGSSRIEYACFAAMHSFPKSITDEQIHADLSALKKRYLDLQSKISLAGSVSYRVDVFTISRGLTHSPPDTQNNGAVELECNHHFAGAIISYFKKE
jgi:hypothetical protein